MMENVINMIRKECKIWKEVYPKQANFIENFTNKIIVELKIMKEKYDTKKSKLLEEQYNNIFKEE